MNTLNDLEEKKKELERDIHRMRMLQQQESQIENAIGANDTYCRILSGNQIDVSFKNDTGKSILSMALLEVKRELTYLYKKYEINK